MQSAIHDQHNRQGDGGPSQRAFRADQNGRALSLQEELIEKGITCAEVYLNEEPIYIRLKPVTTSADIDVNDILEIFDHLEQSSLEPFIEKFGNNLPKLMTACIQHIWKERQAPDADEQRYTLVTPTSRERNFQRSDLRLGTEGEQMARDMITAKKELSQLQLQQKERKKSHKEVQKQVEDDVRKVLKHIDPAKMTQKVHMVQEDGEWIYYLKCHKKQRPKSWVFARPCRCWKAASSPRSRSRALDGIRGQDACE